MIDADRARFDLADVDWGWEYGMTSKAVTKPLKRPVYLNLLQIRQPIGAVISILHRITGAILALLIPVALYVLQRSMASPMQFERIREWLNHPIGRALWLFALWLLVQHFYSGLRHLFMDIDIGVELKTARRNGWLTLVASVLTVAVLGVVL
jgi:succinate dehydrogenase / fumarate reductase cytochrome b subunit